MRQTAPAGPATWASPGSGRSGSRPSAAVGLVGRGGRAGNPSAPPLSGPNGDSIHRAVKQAGAGRQDLGGPPPGSRFPASDFGYLLKTNSLVFRSAQRMFS